jgi:hypothetical protein
MNEKNVKKATGKEIHSMIQGRNKETLNVYLYDGLERHIGTIVVTYNSIHVIFPSDVELKLTSLPVTMIRGMPPTADKIATYLKVLKELEAQNETHPIAKQDKLFQTLHYQFDFTNEELKSITRELLRNGTIYEPREFYLKVT